MTIQKVALEIRNELMAQKLPTPEISTIVEVLTGLALLTDDLADPDCVYSNKINIVLADVANDVRSA